MAKKLYIGIVRDHSASMRGREHIAMRDYNSQLASMQADAKATGLETSLTVYECTSDYNNTKNRFVETNRNIQQVSPMYSYVADGRSTPLLDSIGELISYFSVLPDIDSPDTQVLIQVFTDGEENSSYKWSTVNLTNSVRAKTSTDRWTFTGRVPYGVGRRLELLGFPLGNIHEWDVSNNETYEKSTILNRSATTGYMAAVASGAQTSTAKFYTDLSNVSASDVASNMVDVSKQVRVLTTTTTEEIKPFVERLVGHYKKGTAFYQLTKTEPIVQDYKVLMVSDKKTGAVYVGANARALLKLPTVGNCRVAPGNHGNFEIFIQSTSINRKLPGGSKLVLWDANNALVAGQTLPVAAVPTTVVATPKIKPAVANVPGTGWPFPGVATTNVASKPVAKKTAIAPKAKAVPVKSDAWMEGYKAGRNKKRNLLSTKVGQNYTDYLDGFTAGKADRPR